MKRPEFTTDDLKILGWSGRRDTVLKVPTDIECSKNKLRWTRQNEADRRPDLNMIIRFANISQSANPEVRARAVGRFAKKYGPLYLCDHGKPATHMAPRHWLELAAFVDEVRNAAEPSNPGTDAVGETTDEDDEPWDRKSLGNAPCLNRYRTSWGPSGFTEPVDRWLEYSRQAMVVLDRAWCIENGRGVGTDVDWQPILTPGGRSEPLDSPLSAAPSTPLEARRALSLFVQHWLDLGAAEVSFEWQAEVPALGIKVNSLFGELAVQLALVVSRSAGMAVCSNDQCKRPYIPKRTPSPGRDHYCSECGKKAARRESARRLSQGVERNKSSKRHA